MVIPICLQVVIVSDHFLGRNYRSRAKVQLPTTLAAWVLPREAIHRVLKGPCPPLGRLTVKSCGTSELTGRDRRRLAVSASLYVILER